MTKTTRPRCGVKVNQKRCAFKKTTGEKCRLSLGHGGGHRYTETIPLPKHAPYICVRPKGHPGAHWSRKMLQAHRKSGREASHAYQMRAKYGITADEYQAIYEAQGGRCFICRRATGKTRRLSVDHDHHHDGDKRGSVRGLLCSRCNSFLGHLRDDLETVDRIRQYLTNPPARAVLGFGSEGE